MPLQDNRKAPGEDGTPRKAHYGSGRQPWDDMVDLGWGPDFAAGSILKYLRRAKDPDHSLESAKWYYAQLYAHAAKEYEQRTQGSEVVVGSWTSTLGELETVLTNDEMKQLRGQ